MASLAANALVGLASLNLREAHRRALALTYATPKLLRRVGLGALSSFSYSEAEEDLLRVTLQRFEELRKQPNPETDDVLARAYGLLIGSTEEAPGAFVEIAGRLDPAVQAQVAFILFRRAESDRRQEWYRKALLCLARLPTTQAGTLDELDHCLALCAADEPEFATGFVEAFVTSRSYGEEESDAELPEVLDETFSILRRSAPHALEVMSFLQEGQAVSQMLEALIESNPSALNPLFDGHAIDIGLGLLALTAIGAKKQAASWLEQLGQHVIFAYRLDRRFPIATDSFDDIVSMRFEEGPSPMELKELSTLVPLLADWFAVLNLQHLYADFRTAVTLAYWSRACSHDFPVSNGAGPCWDSSRAVTSGLQ